MWKKLSDSFRAAAVVLVASTFVHNPKLIAIAALTAIVGYCVMQALECLGGLRDGWNEGRAARSRPRLSPAQEAFLAARERIK